MSTSSRRGVLLVVLLLIVAACVSGVGLLFIALAGGAPPTVPASATVYLNIAAPYDEVQTIEPIFVTEKPTLKATVDGIAEAARDSRVKALVILPQAEGALWGQLQELRSALVAFRKSGKPLTAYLEYGGAQEYYLASAADRVVMMPAGQLDLTGLASYELFFRGALDKLGVLPDMMHIGDYKTYSNTFTEHDFTPAHREMTTSLNREWYDQLVAAIADGRKRSEADVRTAIDAGPFLAEEALRAGLVDQLAYEDDLAKAPPIRGTSRMDGGDYLRAAPPPAPGPSRVALLYAVGTIASGKSSFDGLSGTVLGSDTFADWVRKVRLDPSIKAIIVRIDSPGGSAIASESMWHELALAREVKPVIVSMGNVAASGGYYIATPADVIVAEPGTITGSIGIVTGKFVVKGTLDKIGVGEDSVANGKFAQIDSPFQPFSTEERARIDAEMHSTYELFLRRVADGRHSTPEQIDRIGQGRVWTGSQARERHLVDELGGLDTAIAIAKQKAKLDPGKDVDLVIYPMKRTIFDWLQDPFGSTSDAEATVLLRRPEVRAITAAASMAGLFHRGELLAVLPSVFWN